MGWVRESKGIMGGAASTKHYMGNFLCKYRGNGTIGLLTYKITI